MMGIKMLAMQGTGVDSSYEYTLLSQLWCVGGSQAIGDVFFTFSGPPFLLQFRS
jgi:hypothetical protein